MAVVLFCLFNLLCLWLLVKPYGFFSSLHIFVAAFYLYYVISFADYFIGANSINYAPAEAVTELVFINLFIGGLGLAKMIGRKPTEQISSSTVVFAPPSLNRALFSSYLLVFGGLLLYVSFIYVAYGGLGIMLHIDRYELYQKKKGLGSLLIGLNICFVGALMRIAYYFLYGKVIRQKIPMLAIMTACLLLILQLKNSDRSNLILFLLPLCLVFLYRKPKLNYHLLYIVPALLVVMQVIAIQRRAAGTKMIYLSEYFSPAKVDKKVYENIHTVKTRYGGTYGDVLLNMPTSWLSVHRPDLPPVWYAKAYFPNVYTRGGGLGFSIISEALMNFYFFGPFIYGVLLGLLLLYTERRLRGGSFYYFVCYCAMQFYVFSIPRSGFACLIKPALFTVIIPVAVAGLISSWVYGKS